MLCVERRVKCGEISDLKRQKLAAQPGVLKSGVVERRSVSDILRTLVHYSLVPEGKLKSGDAVAICCARGDIVLYPLADIAIEVVQPRSLEEESSVWMNKMDDSLFGQSKEKEKKIRREKREEKR